MNSYSIDNKLAAYNLTTIELLVAYELQLLFTSICLHYYISGN